MVKDEVTAILQRAGFTHHPSDFMEGLGSTFTRPSLPGWIIGAYASWRDPAHVDVGLKASSGGHTIGTCHRFHSAGVLQNGLHQVIANLEAMTAQPDIMKCPKCRSRWVVVKESSQGRPFLSCEGMRVAGRGPNKNVLCRGTSDRIPPVLDYR
jgi:hypothetical protein